MPAKRKELGDYDTKISNYLRTQKKILTPQGLNNALDIDRKFVYDCRRRSSPWQRKFLKSYDKARAEISTHMLEKALVKPEIIYQHWRLSHPNDFDLPNIETQEANSNIIINLPSIRKIDNDSNE
ncbi:hypothetical protein [Spiroplasma endosymbiont of Polydrusus pterygomalis]|uniref:hypothetical protein n=1 Tax=Spiroplasma endosymbiont of Polydrusus pterygomalis TaxID=3139327 RepID=UPI003CCA78C9